MNSYFHTDGQTSESAAEKETAKPLKIGGISLSIFKRDPRLFLLALLKGGPYVLAGAAIVAIVGGVYLFLLKPKVYEARAMLLRVQTENQRTVGGAAYKPIANSTVVDMIRSQANMFKVRKLLQCDDISLMQMYNDTAIELRKSQGNIFIIIAKAGNPKRAADMANCMAETFLEDYQNMLRTMLQDVYGKHEANYKVLNRELDEKRQNLQKFCRELDVHDFQQEQQSCAAQINELGRRIDTERGMLAAARANVEELRKKNIEQYNEYTKKISDAEDELIRLRMLFTEENPTVINAVAALEELKRRQEADKAKGVTRAVLTENSAYRVQQELIGNAEARMFTSQEVLKNLEASLSKQMVRQERLQDAQPRYNQLMTEINAKSNVVAELGQKLSLYKMSVIEPSLDIQLYERARAPGSNIAGKRSIILAGMFLLALVLGAAVILLREAFNMRIRSRQDFDDALEITSIGLLPVQAPGRNALYYGALQEAVGRFRSLVAQQKIMWLFASYQNQRETEAMISECDSILSMRDIRTLKISVNTELPPEATRFLLNDFLFRLTDDVPKPDAEDRLYFKIDEMCFFIPPEKERVRAILERLKGYDAIVWSIDVNEDSQWLMDSLSNYVDQVVFAVRYGAVSKFRIARDVDSAKSKHESGSVFGMIYDIPKKIYKWVV